MFGYLKGFCSLAFFCLLCLACMDRYDTQDTSLVIGFLEIVKKQRSLTSKTRTRSGLLQNVQKQDRLRTIMCLLIRACMKKRHRWLSFKQIGKQQQLYIALGKWISGTHTSNNCTYISQQKQRCMLKRINNDLLEKEGFKRLNGLLRESRWLKG